MIAGRRYSGAKADIWSLGVCLFAMLCGYLPFEDPDTGALYKKILAGTYKVASFVSSEAQDLIAAMLTTDPSRRIGAGAICEHPWFVNRCAAPLPPGPPLTLQPEKVGAVMEVGLPLTRTLPLTLPLTVTLTLSLNPTRPGPSARAISLRAKLKQLVGFYQVYCDLRLRLRLRLRPRRSMRCVGPHQVRVRDRLSNAWASDIW